MCTYTTHPQVLLVFLALVMDKLPDEPCPLQIINVDEESHTINLDEKLLEKILLAKEIKSNKVMVLTVAGAFRQGKSFFLNFLLKYLKAVESIGGQVLK